MLIVISGLPGVGKTTLARALARRLSAVHVSVDTVEDALLGAGHEPGWTTGVAAYEAARAVAEQNLKLGHTVVVDAVNDSEAARRTWRAAADATGAALQFVLLHPPSPVEHQRRLRARDRGLRHVPEPSWPQVVDRSDAYEPWPDEPLRLSTAASPDQLVDDLEVLLS